jgi:hypothetical protein
MSAVLLSVTPSSASVVSGKTVTLTVTYNSTQVGNVQLRCAAPFQVDPTTIALPPAPNGGSVKKDVTIRRTATVAPGRCDILCTFLTSPTLHVFVDVT